MFKLFVGGTELNPVGLGAQKVDDEKLIVTFESEKQLNDILAIFNNMSEDIVKIQNEKREQVYTGFTSLGDEIEVQVNKSGTYNYKVYLNKPSTYDIALRAQADVAFLAATQGIEL